MVVAVWQADKDPGKSTCKVGWQRQFPSKASQLLGCKTMQDLCFKLLQDSAFCKYLPDRFLHVFASGFFCELTTDSTGRVS
jgi:hypothetical protein